MVADTTTATTITADLLDFAVEKKSKFLASTPGNTGNIYLEIFSDKFDDLIWPLQLVDPRDKEQFNVLYPLLRKLPHPVMYYLNDLIFPEVLAYQGLKLAACGQELGGDMLFGRKIGFSGTPSDILPRELGSCQYERGSDGQVVHYLTSTAVVSRVDIASGWTVTSILDLIAQVCIFYFLLHFLITIVVSSRRALIRHFPP